MNKFNKLYNLILQSLITEDIESKIRKAIQTLIKSGQLQSEDDPRAEQVKTIIKRNGSIDINGKTKLDELLKANQKYIKRQQNKELSKDLISYIDNNISQLYNKQTFDKGVVVYKVKDTKDGQKAVRKIIDLCLGYEANPWCLISRNNAAADRQLIKGDKKIYDNNLIKAWEFWSQVYNAYPKRIAFQNGKLIGFSAGKTLDQIQWSDVKDNQFSNLKLLDNTYLDIPTPEWTEEDLKYKQQGFKKEFIFNKETGRYDADHDVILNQSNLENGHFPFPFGIIKGNFICDKLEEQLESLQNGPTRVEGDFNINYCSNLTSLKGAPEYVGRNFECNNCENLKDITGFPNYVGGIIKCEENIPDSFKESEIFQNYSKSCIKTFIKKYKLILNKQTNKYDCDGDVTIPKDLPLVQNGHLIIPFGIVKGNFIINFTNIVNLTNCPERVEGNFNCSKNNNLKSLEGAPKYVNGNFICDACQNLQTFNGLQNTIIKGNFSGMYNYKFINLKGAPKKINGDFILYNCSGLTSLQGGPQYVSGDFDIERCYKLKSLNGLPKYIGKNIKYSFCGTLFDKKDIPSYVKFGKK